MTCRNSLERFWGILCLSASAMSLSSCIGESYTEFTVWMLSSTYEKVASDSLTLNTSSHFSYDKVTLSCIDYADTLNKKDISSGKLLLTDGILSDSRGKQFFKQVLGDGSGRITHLERVMTGSGYDRYELVYDPANGGYLSSIERRFSDGVSPETVEKLTYEWDNFSKLNTILLSTDGGVSTDTLCTYEYTSFTRNVTGQMVKSFHLGNLNSPGHSSPAFGDYASLGMLGPGPSYLPDALTLRDAGGLVRTTVKYELDPLNGFVLSEKMTSDNGKEYQCRYSYAQSVIRY